MQLEFLKLNKGNIFCEDFINMNKNNIIDFTNTNINVLYAPNGVGIHSQSRYLYFRNGTINSNGCGITSASYLEFSGGLINSNSNGICVVDQYHTANISHTIEELNRKVSEEEYDKVLEDFDRAGLYNGWLQEL